MMIGSPVAFQFHEVQLKASLLSLVLLTGPRFNSMKYN